MPLRRPMKAGNDINVNRLASVSVPVPGFKINTVPVSAASTQASWYGFAFSFSTKYENIIAKNGDSLFNIEASEICRWAIA